MRQFAQTLGVLMMIGGGIWILQGIDILPGSFMTGDIRWAWRGGGLALAGGVIFLIAHRLAARGRKP